MRATLRRIVRPRLSSEAQSRATPAFLDVLTSMLPERVVGPGHPQVHRAGAQRDDLGVERGADAGQHLEGEVLVALLDPVDGTLTGGQPLGQLLLGEPAVLARVADEVPDPALVVVSHQFTVSHV